MTGTQVVGRLVADTAKGLLVGDPLTLVEQDVGPMLTGLILMPFNAFSNSSITCLRAETVVHHTPVTVSMKRYYDASLDYVLNVHLPAIEKSVDKATSQLDSYESEMSAAQEEAPAVPVKRLKIDPGQLAPGSNTSN